MSQEPKEVRNLVIRASAGTGKTYQLVTRYLSLLFREGRPEKILAATFARKASSEILDRVVNAMIKSIRSESEMQALRQRLDARELDRDRIAENLEILMKGINRVQIGTLDSLFGQIGGSFPLELGLPLNWRIVEESQHEQLCQKALQDVMQEEKTSDLITLLNFIYPGNSSAGVSDRLMRLVRKLHGDFCNSTWEDWHRLSRPPGVSDDRVQAIKESLLSFAGWPSDNQRTTCEKDLALLDQKDWKELAGKGLFKKILNNETFFKSKEIPREVRKLYQELVEYVRAHVVQEIATETEGQYELLAKFDKKFKQRQMQSHAVRFDDVTRAVIRGWQDEAIGLDAFRLDMAPRHVLLDEFQDTSVSQWRGIEPITEHVLTSGTGTSLFAVGDANQAIYVWRGGESRFLNSLAGRLPDRDVMSLTTSYRSCQKIIDVVNRVFGSLENNPALGNYRNAVNEWFSRFQTHSTSKGDLEGYFAILAPAQESKSKSGKVQTAPDEGGSESERQGSAKEGKGEKKRALLEYSARLVVQLAQQYPRASMGVLLRTNDEILTLLQIFRSQHEIDVSVEAKNPILDSACVQVILACLRLADHPGDTIARFQLANSPLGTALQFQDFLDDGAANQLSLFIRDELLTQGYGNTIHRWAGLLTRGADHREAERLMQLRELALRYDEQATLRTDDFIEFLSHTKLEEPNLARIRLMTLHQAKGLEFDIVVLPYLEQDLEGLTPSTIVTRSHETNRIERVTKYVSEPLLPLTTKEVQEAHARYWDEQIIQSLSLLYVGLTRAIHSLYAVIDGNRKPGKSPYFSDVLRGALCTDSAASKDDFLFEHGDRNWNLPEQYRSEPGQASRVEKSADHPPEMVRLASPRRDVPAEIVAPSRLEGGEQVSLSRELQKFSEIGTALGLIHHVWLASVVWSDDPPPNDDMLQRLAQRLKPKGIQLKNEVRLFRRYMNAPTTRRLLSRDWYADFGHFGFDARTLASLHAAQERILQLARERPYAIRKGNQIERGVLDRLVIIADGEKALAAEVIDFKTDAVADAEALARLTEFYRPQLESYRNAVCSWTGLPKTAVSCRLLFVRDDKVVSL